MGNKNTKIPIAVTTFKIKPNSITINKAVVQWNVEIVDPSINMQKSKKSYYFKLEYSPDLNSGTSIALPLIKLENKLNFYQRVLNNLDQDTKYNVKLYLLQCSAKKKENNARLIPDFISISLDFTTLSLKMIQDAKKEKLRLKRLQEEKDRFYYDCIRGDVLVCGQPKSSIPHIQNYMFHVIPFNKAKYHDFITNHKDGKTSPFTIYFKEHNIKIRKICVNSSEVGLGVFWITENDKVYVVGAGAERSHTQATLNQWSIEGYYHKRTKQKYKDCFIPKLIDDLCGKHIVYIGCNRYNGFKIAISSSQTNCDIVSKYWYRNEFKSDLFRFIPNDIIIVIEMFYGMNNELYVTGHNTRKYFGKIDVTANMWVKIDNDKFNTQNIIAADVGNDHCLLLDSNGDVFGCGSNYVGKSTKVRLRRRRNREIVPERIEYFAKNDIRIKDIKCGLAYSFALDTKNRLYGWGRNPYGNLGEYVNDKHRILSPQLIDYFKNVNVVEIQASYNYSYVKTLDNKHYLFGWNGRNNCLHLKIKRNIPSYQIV